MWDREGVWGWHCFMVPSRAELLVTYLLKPSGVMTHWSQMTNVEICNMLRIELSNQHNEIHFFFN